MPAPSRYRVQPAGVQRMTPQQPTDSEIATACRPEPLHRLHCVGRARRDIPTRRSTKRTNRLLICPHRGQHRPSGQRGHQCLPGSGPARSARRQARCNAASRSEPRTSDDASAAAGKARTTTVDPASSVSIRTDRRARKRRLTRCRTTELPTPRPTTSPTRVTAGSLESHKGGTRWTTSVRRALRRPVLRAVAKSPDRRRRCRAGSIEGVRRTESAARTQVMRAGRQADSSRRPLRRRPVMMARPARVRMRRRNPWVLARRRLLG